MISQPLVPPIHLRHMSIAAKKGGSNQKIKFVNPNVDNYEKNIEYAASLHRKGVQCYKMGMLKKGTTAVVVGSGPSLKSAESLDALRVAVDRGYTIFACKQAIGYLHHLGIKMNYGVTMDPGAHIARPEKIYKAPGLTHLIASSSDTLLFDYMLAEKPFDIWLESLTEEEQRRILENDFDDWIEGRYIPPDAGERKSNILIFHSATGYKDEVKMYNELFDTHECMGGGYNVVNRAVSAALFMGAEKVICIGTDCGWRADENFYVDDSSQREGVDMSDHGIVENTDDTGLPIPEEDKAGREWMTRPDMLASGVALAKLAKRNPGMIEFVGDTLPSKLVHKDFAFLDKCASFG